MAVPVTDGNGDTSMVKIVTDAVPVPTGDKIVYRREYEDFILVFSTIQGC